LGSWLEATAPAGVSPNHTDNIAAIRKKRLQIMACSV
jgi:hypothetical protein